MNATNPRRLVDLVNDLIGRGEAAWVEFKQDNADPKRIGVVVPFWAQELIGS